ncbi:hypothetical protein BJ170DRAFT_678081 [Xylariales sp. AK1849]|nr:hypothetical protein BJ170DRAFT_678081 [Xylariales sp. AK1849]
MSSSSGNYRSAPLFGQQPAETFTAEMRDRQARGKDPYQDSSDSSDSWGSRHRPKDEPFAVVERRRIAAQVLDTPELLMMNAQRDNASIPATRLRYTRMLCGIEEPPSHQARSASAKKSTSSSSPRHGGSKTPSKRAGDRAAR